MIDLWSHKHKAVVFMWKISPAAEIIINLHYTVKREREISKVDFIYIDLLIGNVLEGSSSAGNLRLAGRY